MNKQQYIDLGYADGVSSVAHGSNFKDGSWQHKAYIQGYERGVADSSKPLKRMSVRDDTKAILDAARANADAAKPGRAQRDAQKIADATLKRIGHRMNLRRIDKAKPQKARYNVPVSQNIKRASR